MTIRDVAARAGVSAATVSRVFSHPQAVTLETRRRVLAAADELRYAPHPVARSLARGHTGNLGLVVPDIAVAFCAVVTKAVSHRARGEGYALFVADSDEPSIGPLGGEVRSARAMAKQVDGLLLLSPTMSDDDLRALAAEMPLVVINRRLDGVPAVLMPSADGAADAVEHLYALGHRRIGYLAGPDNYSNRGRVDAFARACSRFGVESAVLGPFDPTFSGGARAADLVLAHGWTAVVAYNDDVAAGVIGRLADRGVAVPERLSIVGFDDTSLASMVNPRLTTVRLPMADAGAAAVRLLLNLVRGAGRPNVPLELPVELIVRASTGRAPEVAA
jgi:LacI family transcriptional regulator/LacI family repressor for deo operon, udp, cdd, tsx, nupC, and nupG